MENFESCLLVKKHGVYENLSKFKCAVEWAAFTFVVFTVDKQELAFGLQIIEQC